MAAQSFVTVGGLNTHYLHAGAGPTLIMLHGQLPGSTAAVEFGDSIEFFARAGYSVYAPDLAGFGLTDNPDDYAIEARIAHAKAFIDFIAPRRYAIWGCSMGTYIGAAIALDDPRADRLVIMPSSLLPPPAAAPASTGDRPSVGSFIHHYAPTIEKARQLLSLVLVNGDRVTEELVRQFVEASSGKNEEAERQRRLAPRPRPLYGDLKRLEVPSLLLWGTDDPASTPERAVLLLREMPRAELHLLHACGHWPQRDRPARSHRLVAEFLAADF